MSFQKQVIQPYLIWLVSLVFFAFQFVLRLWPGLMMQEIMQQFTIDAANFGLLAAFYYYGYAGMQIPMALLMDRFNPTTVIFCAALLCGASSFFFIHTHHVVIGMLCRFLTGVGSAAGFLGVSKIISIWFQPKDYSRMIGLSFSIGLLGAVYGGKPLALSLATYGTMTTGNTLSFLAISIGVLIMLLPKKKDNGPLLHSKHTLQKNTCFVWYRSKTLWILALANFLMVGALEGFADVWGVPWLTTVTNFSKPDCALLVSFIFVGMLFGGPLLSLFSRYLGNYLVIALSGTGIALIFFALLWLKFDHQLSYIILFFIIGLLCCYQVIVFSAGASLVPEERLGLTVALLNCVNMLGGSFFHTVIGHLMMTAATTKMIETATYTKLTFQNALLTIPISALIGACLIVWLMRATKKIM